MRKVLFVSSSGGHFEQLKMLKPLMDKYPNIIVTEKTSIRTEANYFLLQTNHKDKLVHFKMLINFILSIKIWYKEKPDYVISTGSMIILPFYILAKLTKKKVIYVETFSRINDGTKTGIFMKDRADLFIVQWEELLKIYPNATYGGSIY